MSRIELGIMTYLLIGSRPLVLFDLRIVLKRTEIHTGLVPQKPTRKSKGVEPWK
jgi:hypothetical protein